MSQKWKKKESDCFASLKRKIVDKKATTENITRSLLNMFYISKANSK